MDQGLAPGLGVQLGALSRIVDGVVSAGVPLNDPVRIRRAARRLAADEAPLEPGIAEAVVEELTGLGPLDPLLEDPLVTDILVNAPDEVWVERAGVMTRAPLRFSGEAAVIAAVERAVSPLGLRIDRASPAVDARLPDGSRLHAVIPPASVRGPVVAIRRFVPAVETLDDLEAEGAIDSVGAGLLRELVTNRKNVIVCGGTGSGKTTLLNLLLGEISDGERVVSIEDSAELRIRGHVVRLEARPPNAEGRGEITLRTLTRHALRMRPDRIVVGEVRGPEALDLIQAMSTGHSGSMGTVHAGGPEEALWRLETLALSSSMPVSADAVRRMLWSAVEAIVHLERDRDRRRVRSIHAVGSDLEEAWRC